MKKVLILILLLISGFTLISCSNDTDTSSIPTKDNPTVPQDEETEVISPDYPQTPPQTEVTPPVEIDGPEDNDPIKFNFTKKVQLTYEFVGDEKDKAGFAQGYIYVEPTTSTKKSGFYIVYLANEEGILDNYDEFAILDITGEKSSYYVKDGRHLPSEATMLCVFESNKRFYTSAPDITTAADIIRLPKAKRLNLGTLETTFGSTSDVHINFEDLGFGSRQKWVNALDFFESNNTEFLIITGDMTGDTNLDTEYTYYIDAIKNTNISVDKVYEAIGNHGNTPSQLSKFNEYTSSSNEIHPFAGSPYYHVVEGNNILIFMAQELNGPSDSAAYDNFSKNQIDWLEDLLLEFGNTDKNIFITIHSPFLNFGPGDRHYGDYVRMITFKQEYTQTMRLKGLLETYKDVIVLSGHTHLTYYEGENYSNENDSFARMIHVSSGTQTSSYNHGDTLISDTDGREKNSTTYGSEGYIVKIYEDYILFIGYNISTNKIIPAGTILLPKKAYGGTFKEPIDGYEDEQLNVNFFDIVEGKGTKEDPYLIDSELVFYAFSKEWENSKTSNLEEMFGYGKYFQQTQDIDMSKVKQYSGTDAFGSSRYTFAGNYNGNGYKLNVKIDAPSGNRSIFPYVYGSIFNLKVTGSIKGGTCAQPVRALYGTIANCIFDLKLEASQTAGIIYSNYGTVYNCYVTGSLTGDPMNPIAVGNNSTKYYDVFYNFGSITSSYGTFNNNINDIVNKLNLHTHSEYLNILSQYGIEFINMEYKNSTICFK